MKTQNEIVALLGKIISNNSPDLKSGNFPYKVISDENKSLILSRETAKPFDSLCSKILRMNDWDQKFSQKYIEKKVESLVIQTYDSPSDVREGAVIHMLEELGQYESEQEVFLPVLGIRLDTETFELGNISFKQITDQFYSEIIERCHLSIDSTKNSDEEKAYLKQFLDTHVMTAIKIGTLAAIKVSAEPIRALERAQEECGRSLDLLRFATPYVQQNPEETGFGLIGDVLSGKGISLCFSEDGSLKLNQSNVGSWIPFEFDRKVHQKLERIGIMTLSELLKKDNPTEYEKRVLSAVFWCAKAQLQTSSEFRLLCLITSLEAVLNPRGDRPIRMGIAEGVALLIGKELEQKRNLRNFIAKLYNQRSSVSHGGHPEVLESELRRLTSYIGAVVFELLKKTGEFRSQKELLSWIDDLRLT